MTRMLRASGLLKVAEEAPLVELLKDLAAEMDAGGGARTRADYLSALKDVRRVLASAPGSAGASEVEKAEKDAAPATEPAEDAGVTDFARFKRAKGSASVG
ncbi:hypothetical protein [Microbacterium luteum]|uniref:hypothetical protein n=1 Tax=Microbacterium luteum TaxID=2782167 RepID=UPI001888B6BB|nr:hypothetical protein [Microbacterium luteum]